ncbi:glycoside hydrolase family 3 N-terminal domain-containing protein [Ovoidimarina sediminis]|uniref:glycoside hydrolase family 3 N-terminal domain-containing protein n=1 Tax=Ovoidimarina sediminis TaxID=3079856 RepID=UPI00290D0719|nr:glycoside hydrolase family 3 N-terminal domain-containing protein [Rhodophyticola sp. MJ-SS7]MDU8946094.1 glycoside hydrolase family 3 N-terminal domain-containing protein [Rhodophyticola sp. MJ-SS7]
MLPGAYIFGCAGQALSDEERAFFRDSAPWGFILFARNIDTPDQLRALVEDLRESVGRQAPVLIDQEGGRVQRLGPPHWRQWAPPLDFIEAAGEKAERAMFLRYRIIAAELMELGIDVNCVPCADVATDDTHPFLRNRCYGTTADDVARLARAAATGLHAGGVLPVLKHIPGHGRGTVDSHLGLPATDTAPEALDAQDFAAFRALSDLPLGMTAHMVYAAYDPENAATVSRRVIRLIRERIGFGGLLMTDDLSMEALGGTMTTRTRASLAAGCDIILHCNGEMAEMREIAAEAGRLSAPANDRARRALRLRTRPQPIDIRDAEAELKALGAGLLT